MVSVLRGPRLSLGPKMEEFEGLVRNMTAQQFGIAVSSGTAGLHLCIRGLGIGPGDEVVVPSFTFVAAANAVRYEGATPVFADIEPRTLNLDPASVEASITPRTRAIIVVHTFGCPAEMGAILDIA
ncbi:MAG TPA: aminotransferase class I/II-fold pyridoxal phosphate-dependent enzyme, partial [Acidobacteriaceae bacterium]